MLPRHNDAVGSQVALILTSTLRPHAGVAVKVNSERLRAVQYLETLRWWKRNSPWPILFADNSGSSLLNELRFEGGEDCVVIAVEPPPEDLAATRGKGLAEAFMLREAMTRLDPKFTAIVKVTGRLTVRNIGRCLASMDGRFVTCKISPDLTFSDSRVFAGDRESLRYLVNRVIDGADDESGRYFEHELAAGALSLISGGVPFRAFHRLPSVRGVSGTSGNAYGGAFHEAARLAHDGVRRFVRWRHLSL